MWTFESRAMQSMDALLIWFGLDMLFVTFCVLQTRPTTHTYNAFLKYDLTKYHSYSACHNSIHLCILSNQSIVTVQFP